MSRTVDSRTSYFQLEKRARPADWRQVVRAALTVLALVLALPAAASAAVDMHGDKIPPTADAVPRGLLSEADIRLVPSSIPSAWCGTERTSDYTGANQQGSGPMVKVIYAYPSDATDHLSQYDDQIQSDAGTIADAYADATAAGTAKTVRFDLGNDGGTQCLDILTVHLPNTGAFYRAKAPDLRIGQLRTDLAGVMGGIGGIRNYLVYADGLYQGSPTGGVTGIAETPIDDSLGGTHGERTGGRLSVVFGNGSANFSIGTAR